MAGGLLEREAVLAELGRLWRRVNGGAGRLVFVRGEAGVGKTAVIARFLAGLDSRAAVLRGWCDPLDSPRPLGPLVDALSDLGHRTAAGLDEALEAGDTSTLYRRLLAVLGDGQRRVWVIEDAHWADGATLDLVRFLARRIDSLPLMLLVSYRDDELGAQHPLALTLGDVARFNGLSRVALESLSRPAVATLASGSGINAGELYELTGGNPFYVTEVLAAGVDALGRDALPRSVSEAVWGRLGRLSESARQTAEAVAVCGPRSPSALVASMRPAAAELGLAECLDAGVLVADGPIVAFRHELARRATLMQIPGHQHRLLHKAALAALGELPVDPDMLAALVFHADQAGDCDAVLCHGPDAAERAAALGAHSQAAELYSLTLSRAGAVDAGRRAHLLERCAFESYLCGQADVAVSCWREAIELRRAAGDVVAEGEDLRWLSEILMGSGRTGEASEAAVASVQLLEDLGPSRELAWSVQSLAQIALARADPAAADHAARAIALGTEVGDPTVVARARFYAALDTVLCSGEGWEALEAAWRETTGIAGFAEQAGMMGALICWFAVLSRELGRAEGYLAAAVAFCDDHDLSLFRIFTVGAGALGALHGGDWADASMAAEQVLTLPGLSPLMRVMPLVTVSLIRARRGERPVWPLLDEALSCAGELDRRLLWLVQAARAEAAWLDGDDTAAHTAARIALNATPALVSPWLVGDLRRWAHLSGGQLQATDGDPLTPYESEIRGDWRTAADAWTLRGCPYDAAVAQLGGDVGAVQSALDAFRKLGARAAARRAKRQLTVLRGRTRRARTRADPQQLSVREREVLTHLAAGRSNADIAAALHLSPRTVGHHASAIFAKLGVENRTQAAALVHHPPPSDQPGGSLVDGDEGAAARL